MTEIKECPFCGSEDVKLVESTCHLRFSIKCYKCHCLGPGETDVQLAIKSWNEAPRKEKEDMYVYGIMYYKNEPCGVWRGKVVGGTAESYKLKIDGDGVADIIVVLGVRPVGFYVDECISVDNTYTDKMCAITDFVKATQLSINYHKRIVKQMKKLRKRAEAELY